MVEVMDEHNARTKLSTAFLEDYLLSENRLGEVSKEFDRDHVEYWYYSVLALQNSKAADAANQLRTWLEKLKKTSFIEMDSIKRLLLRQALRTGAKADFLERINELLRKRDADMAAAAKKEACEPKSTYTPDTSMRMVEAALTSGPIADVFTDEATPFLAKLASTNASFSSEQIGDLLDLIDGEPPDQHHLITLIVKDLRATGAEWGSRKIHAKLTLDQMGAVYENQGALLSDIKFCEAYAVKLRGGAVPLYGDEPVPLMEYLAKLKKWSTKVGKELTSFRGLILYNHLIFSESTYEQYDRETLSMYLKIPKSAKFMAKPAARGVSQKNDYVVPGLPELECVVDDEPFIRRALRYFYSTGDKAGNWTALNKDWALSLWAEEALLAGRGNEKFQTAQRVTIDNFHRPGYSKELKTRKILALTPMNRKYYKVDEEVELDLWLKNMPSVVVNVYMVCAEAYYVQNLKEVPSKLNLAGCEPFESFDVAYDDRIEMALIKERIKISSLSGKRGLFIIDILGGAIGVRAVVRKGALRFIERQVDEGYRFRVMNEKNEDVPDGKVCILGNWYYPDDTGEIPVPFADVLNMEEPVVVSCDNSSVALLSTFDRKPHKYTLITGFYVEREHMLAKKMAKLVMRPNLYINEFFVTLKHIKKPTLTITTTDNVGAQCTRVVEVELTDNEETIAEFLVPVCMRSVECTLKGSVEGINVHARQFFECNSMDDGSDICDMFMYTAGRAGYVISVQGKNGEPYANEKLDLEFEHRMFQETQKSVLKSDHNGMVYLGKLQDIRTVQCKPRNPVIYGVQKWNILIDRVNVPPVICAVVGKTINIPWLSRPSNPPRIRIYDEAYSCAHHEKAQYQMGYVHVKNLPAGDYICYIRDKLGAQVSLHVQEGKQKILSGNEFVMGTTKSLEVSEDMPLQICKIAGDRAQGYTLTLRGCNEMTRVHCFATTHLPRYTAYSLLAAPNQHPEVNGYKPQSSSYEVAHAIAADSAYVLNRKTPAAVPNMLCEPSITSGPWAPGPQKISPPPLDREPSERFIEPNRVRVYEKHLTEVYGAELKSLVDTSNLEFLSHTARSFPNLKPNEDGIVKIQAGMYNEQHRLLYFVAVDDDNTVLRHVILDMSEDPAMTNDCTLSPGLPVNEDYMERRRCMCLMPGDELRIEDILTSEFEPFEGIDELFYLFRALKSMESPEAKEEIAKFEWIVCWENLSEEDRLANWEQFQCNEVNYFLYRKDPEFFSTVVEPAVRAKLQRSFFDQYLLGEDLSSWIRLDLLQTLNTFERILLASKLGGAWGSNCCQNIATEAALVPDSPQESDRRILLALKSRQLSQDLMDASMAHPAKAAEPEAKEEEATITADQTIQGLGMSGAAPLTCDDDGPADMTMVHEERWYYGVALADQDKGLVTPTLFWKDYASYVCGLTNNRGAFLSEHAIKSTKNLTEMLLVLAVTDLPFSAPSPKMTELQATASRRPATLLASKPVMIFLKEIAPSTVRTSSFSISTNYFDPGSRTEVVDGQTVDKFLLPKDTVFKTGKVYGCRAVITNVSSVTQTVELLMQIPGGSIPVNGTGDSGFRTKNFVVAIPAFDTHKKEYYFYWPDRGNYEHWPAHICKNGHTVGTSKGETKVRVDTNPVEFHDNYRELCENGEDAEVMTYLESAGSNLFNLDLTHLRLTCSQSYALFTNTCKFLKAKNIYVDEIWSLALKYAKTETAQPMLGEYLAHNSDFREYIGPENNDEVCQYNGYDFRDHQYEQLEPLVNSRVETTQALPAILNDNYRAFLDRICLTSSSVSTVKLSDQAAFCCYLLQQQRYDKALGAFKNINQKAAMAEFPEIYEYMDAFLALSQNQPKRAKKIATRYAREDDSPPQFRSRWEAILDQCEESVNTSRADMTFIPDRIAAEPPKYDIECLKHKLKIKHNQPGEAKLEFWIMDLEMLFSVQPFTATCDSYKYMQPNKVLELKLGGGSFTTVEIPSDLRNCNSIIRLTWGDPDQDVVTNDYDNEIDVQVANAVGEVRVISTERKTENQPVGGAYCKVYSKNPDGSVQFYKDGYTDVRGRFNYRDISTSDQIKAVKYALLVTTDLGSCKLEVDV